MVTVSGMQPGNSEAAAKGNRTCKRKIGGQAGISVYIFLRCEENDAEHKGERSQWLTTYLSSLWPKLGGIDCAHVIARGTNSPPQCAPGCLRVPPNFFVHRMTWELPDPNRPSRREASE